MKLWLLLGIIYSSFFLWYTNLNGSLDDNEIKFFLEKLKQNAEEIGDSLDQDRYARIKVFMERMTANNFL